MFKIPVPAAPPGFVLPVPGRHRLYATAVSAGSVGSSFFSEAIAPNPFTVAPMKVGLDDMEGLFQPETA